MNSPKWKPGNFWSFFSKFNVLFYMHLPSNLCAYFQFNFWRVSVWIRCICKDRVTTRNFCTFFYWIQGAVSYIHWMIYSRNSSLISGWNLVGKMMQRGQSNTKNFSNIFPEFSMTFDMSTIIENNQSSEDRILSGSTSASGPYFFEFQKEKSRPQNRCLYEERVFRTRINNNYIRRTEEFCRLFIIPITSFFRTDLSFFLSSFFCEGNSTNIR